MVLIMKIIIDYIPPNWNKYIGLERANFYGANKLKQKEKEIIRYHTFGMKYKGNYPVELILKPHFKDYRQDIDNFRYKGLIDGLVSNGVIENDNLKHIQKITIEAVFDDKEIVEIEIKENH